ncbi:hypothetical protein ACWEDZ_33085 [Streptomyces sp. NPDC005047]
MSEETALRLEEKSAPANTYRNYINQRRLFAEWCDGMDRVARPCTTTTYVEDCTHLIAQGKSPNTIHTYLSAVPTMPTNRNDSCRALKRSRRLRHHVQRVHRHSVARRDEHIGEPNLLTCTTAFSFASPSDWWPGRDHPAQPEGKRTA